MRNVTPLAFQARVRAEGAIALYVHTHIQNVHPLVLQAYGLTLQARVTPSIYLHSCPFIHTHIKHVHSLTLQARDRAESANCKRGSSIQKDMHLSGFSSMIGSVTINSITNY